jgi:formamidopyrimidine-DNA glycosylase
MPELPEVETVTRQLDAVLPNRVIQSIQVLRDKSFTGKDGELIGKKILHVSRKQKIIVIELLDSLVLLIHLKMTGQLIFQHGGNRVVGGHPTQDWIEALPSKHTRVIIHFTDGSILYFNDQRVFGWVKIVDRQEWIGYREKMAPDVVDEAFTLAYLTGVLKKTTRAVKLVILDQEKIGGMGNIYANDALYLAGIDPRKMGKRVQGTEIKRLYKAMKEVIAKGIETGGASYSHFVDTKGLGGHYQDHFLVYDKAGQPCVMCGSLIEKISVGGRGTYFCPTCQL